MPVFPDPPPFALFLLRVSFPSALHAGVFRSSAADLNPFLFDHRLSVSSPIFLFPGPAVIFQFGIDGGGCRSLLPGFRKDLLRGAEFIFRLRTGLASLSYFCLFFPPQPPPPALPCLPPQGQIPGIRSKSLFEVLAFLSHYVLASLHGLASSIGHSLFVVQELTVYGPPFPSMVCFLFRSVVSPSSSLLASLIWFSGFRACGPGESPVPF